MNKFLLKYIPVLVLGVLGCSYTKGNSSEAETATHPEQLDHEGAVVIELGPRFGTVLSIYDSIMPKMGIA